MKTVRSIFSAARLILPVVLVAWASAARADSAMVPAAPLANDPQTVALFRFDASSPALWNDAVADRATMVPAQEGTLDPAGRFGGALRVTPRTAATTTRPILTVAAADAGKAVFSVQLWVKFQGAQEGRSPMIGRDMYVLGSSGMFLRFSVDRSALEFGILGTDGWVTAVTTKQQFMPPAGKWLFITAEYDGAEARLAVDGQLFSAAGQGGQPIPRFVVGGLGWEDQPSVDFDGWIDELRISKVPRLNVAPLSR